MTDRSRTIPSYVALHRSGELARRAAAASRRLADCDLCARYCHVNRTAAAIGAPRGAVCRTGGRAVVSSYAPHHGEEDCLRGSRGSGTIFFSWCNLRCQFCQNWEISHEGVGSEVEPSDLAQMMLHLQEAGCHNINLVSPSHVVAQALAALDLAADGGLRIPIVYNTGGYDSPEALTLLDGVVDVYMVDVKYGDSSVARAYSRVPDYAEVNRAALREMHRQVGDLFMDDDGIAVRGLLVRHLVMPDGVAGTDDVMRFLAEEISRDTFVNLMDQYRPAYRAHEHPPIARRITADEYASAVASARHHGIWRFDRGAPMLGLTLDPIP